MKRFFTLVGFCFFVSGTAFGNSPPQVLNVHAVQRPNTSLVDVTFDLVDSDGDDSEISLWYSLDAGQTWDHECLTVSGNIGSGVLPASGLSITWDAGTDFPDFIDNQFSLRVYADDGSQVDDFVLISAGTFLMGSPEDELGRFYFENLHSVTLTHDYWLSPFEVTEELWDQVMGGNSNSQRPKIDVSWDNVIQFCNALSEMRGLTPAYTYHGSGHVTWDRDANGYRLPTEAEWEFACRAGSESAYSNGENTSIACEDPVLDMIGRYCGNNEGQSSDVGSLMPNAWGIYDMHGNMYEWCWDEFISDLGYEPVTDPVGGGYEQNSNIRRAFRGGSWSYGAKYSRSAYRYHREPANFYYNLTFRLVRS